MDISFKDIVKLNFVEKYLDEGWTVSKTENEYIFTKSKTTDSECSSNRSISFRKFKTKKHEPYNVCIENDCNDA